MKKYFVYILICSDGSYYVGISNDVFLREQQHNQGVNPKAYTFKRRPVKLVWCQEFLDPEKAISREKQIKGWGRKKKKALIENNYDILPELSKNSLRQAQTDNHWILKKLPYSDPFLFVDGINTVDEDRIEGVYMFKKTSHFYQGHFKDFPVTPGVILTECCAQIGLVCLGIYLLGDLGCDTENPPQIALTSSEMEFYLPVMPGGKVKVVSEKVYFRFNKLKCKVKLFNAKDELVCSGVMAGMFKGRVDGK
ncbi:MAG: GIY-YIG nuclease family protein [Flavobacteriaceae bacterium]